MLQDDYAASCRSIAFIDQRRAFRGAALNSRWSSILISRFLPSGLTKLPPSAAMATDGNKTSSRSSDAEHMMNNSIWFAPVVVCCMAVCQFCLADGPTRPQSAPATRPSTSQPDSAPAFSPKDVVGAYYFGDGLGVNCSLELRKDAQFAFIWRGCLGVYDENVGSWSIEKGMVVLKPTKPNVREGFRGTAKRFYRVPWGEQLYLVPDNEMLDFCSLVKSHFAFDSERSYFFYLRVGDEKKQRTGQPKVPAPYAAYLKTPFSASVLSIRQDRPAGGDRKKPQTAEVIVIDQGSKAGVIPGMRFMIEGGDSLGYFVTRVTEITAECVARGSKGNKGVVKKGASVSTLMGN